MSRTRFNAIGNVIAGRVHHQFRDAGIDGLHIYQNGREAKLPNTKIVYSIRANVAPSLTASVSFPAMASVFLSLRLLTTIMAVASSPTGTAAIITCVGRLRFSLDK